MILSMTGFGKGEFNKNDISVVTTLSSLNSRFFDCKVKLPKRFQSFEEKIYSKVKDFCKRGRISIQVDFDLSINTNDRIEINEVKLDQYLNIIKKLETKYDSIGKMSMEGILSLPSILEFDNSEINEIIEDILFKSLKIGLEDLNKMRKIEGANLGNDLTKRIKFLVSFLNEIESELKNSLKDNLKKYKTKLNSLVDDYATLDENRLLQEVVILLEKKDITEEIVRLKSHFDLFLNFINNKEPIGKKMNFLHQEMLREVNTIGSKTDNITISHIVINMKEELEKIKEQVQNIL